MVTYHNTQPLPDSLIAQIMHISISELDYWGDIIISEDVLGEIQVYTNPDYEDQSEYICSFNRNEGRIIIY